MTALAWLQLVLAIARIISRWVDETQIRRAEERGQDTGAVREFRRWMEAIDAKVGSAGGGSGRVPDDWRDPADRGGSGGR